MNPDPLEFALNKFASEAGHRQEALQILHAVVSTCRQEEALKDKPDATMAAESRVYASLIAKIEEKLKVPFSPVVPTKVQYVPALPTANTTNYGNSNINGGTIRPRRSGPGA